MAIFLFVFLFPNALPPIFPISTRCFVLYFHMLFLFFNPRTGKEGRHFERQRRRLDSFASFPSTREFFAKVFLSAGR